MKKLIMSLAALSFASGICAEPAAPEAALPLMSKAPVIDGKINPEEWAEAAGMCGFNRFGGAEMFPAQSWFWVGRDDKNMYIAVKSETGPDGILEKIKKQDRSVPEVFADETIELVFVPDMKNTGKVFHSAINNKGAYYAVSKDGNATTPWNMDFKSQGTVRDGFWEFEAAFPLGNFGLKPGAAPEKSGLRVIRNFRRLHNGPEWNSPGTWEQAKVAFFSSDSIPVLTWGKSVPAVQVLQLKDSKDSNEPAIKLSLLNPSKQALKCRLDYSFRPSASQSVKDVTTVSLAPGERKILDLPVVKTSASEHVDSAIKVSSEDGGQVYYSREFRWRPERPAKIFADSKNAAPGSRISFNFAFFPSYNKMILQTDLSNEPGADKIKSMTVSLRGPDGKELGSVQIPKEKGNVSRLIWDTPDLKAIAAANGGKAQFSLTLALDDGKNTKIEKTFERSILEWEGNKLGKSDLIVPPFTPIELQDGHLKTILRDHVLNPLGLCGQITAGGIPLLKEGGMRLEAVVDGKKAAASADKLEIVEKKDSAVKTQSSWSAGALSGQASGQWDYDGMLKYVLTINPCAKQIDSLKLLIPLDNAAAPLMHACADGARMNFAGYVPAGAGRVWDSSKNARNSIIGSYVPYIWLGAETFGLCVFGDNDKGWIPSPKVPSQEIIREGDTLYLVLNLIAEPSTVASARQILLGIQATPVKPMPDNWRRWTSWDHLAKDKIKDSAYEMTFLGSGWYYGTVAPCCELYPRDEDIRFWNAMKKYRKDKILPAEYIKEWVNGYRIPGKEGEEKHDSEKKTYYNHVKGGFNRIAATGEPLFYTNARGARFDTREGKTFLDEWYRLPFNSHDYPYGGGVDYDVDPVESFRDYAVHWYKKMMEEAGCDNIYWDDIFPTANFKLVGTDAYVLPNGEIQPSVGIFNMRELVRRCAVMRTEMGGKPVNMVHITSTAMAPVLAFAQLNYDWEDNRGGRDYQNRYTRDYLRTMSIGRQTGNYPMVMSMISGLEKDQYAWCERTASGVMLTHELRWGRGTTNGSFWDGLNLLFDFGYGKPGVKVFNYWDNDFPAKTPGKESASILAVKPGAVMAVVCDWGDGGQYDLLLDLKKLGLKEGFSAVNAENGAALEAKGDKIILNLKKHDYIIIRITQKPGAVNAENS